MIEGCAKGPSVGCLRMGESQSADNGDAGSLGPYAAASNVGQEACQAFGMDIRQDQLSGRKHVKDDCVAGARQ